MENNEIVKKSTVAMSQSHQSWLGGLNAPLNTRAKQKGSSASYPTEDPLGSQM